MLSAKKVLTELSDFNEQLKTKMQSHYTLRRDENAILHIDFSNDEHYQVPIYPFRPYQVVANKSLFEDHLKRQLYSWPRRSGKEYFTWNCLVQAAIEAPGLYLMVYPTNVRARAILWKGAILLQDGTSVRFLDMIPKALIHRINNQDMTVELINGSIIWIMGSDIDPGKLRGTNPRGIVFAEFAFQDPRVMYVMLPVLRQNGGWLIGQSTFDGMNHFYHMIKKNQDDPLWVCRVESVTSLVDENGERYITDEMIEEDRRAGMPEYLIQQEYFGNVEINQETKYFAHAINFLYKNDRIGTGMCHENTQAYTFWDIGVNDKNSITIVQFRRSYGKLVPYIIGYMEDSNREFKYYINELRNFAARKGIIIKAHFAPHDGAKRDYYDELKDIRAHGAELGETFYIVDRPVSHVYAHELIRKALHQCFIDQQECQRLIDCLSQYSKVYDEKTGDYKNEPLHDWSSHGVKSFQTLAIALAKNMISDHTYETVYYTDK